MRITILSILILTLISCENKSTSAKCSKAKFIGTTCSGVLLDVTEGTWIDEHPEQYGTSQFRQFLTASVDNTLVPDNVDYKTLFTADSMFYFQYSDGDRPTLAICSDHAPVLTILSISDNPCNVPED